MDYRTKRSISWAARTVPLVAAVALLIWAALGAGTHQSITQPGINAVATSAEVSTGQTAAETVVAIRGTSRTGDELRGLDLSGSPPVKIMFYCDSAQSETWNNTSADAVNYFLGAEGRQIECLNGASTSAYLDPSPAKAVRGSLQVWMFCADWSKVKDITVDLYTDLSPTTLQYQCYARLNGAAATGSWSMPTSTWAFVPVNFSNATRLSEPNDPGPWDDGFTIERFRVRVTAAVGEDCYVTLGGVTYEDYPKARIVLGLDGSYSDAVEFYKAYSEEYGFPVTLWITGNEGAGGRATWSELYDLIDRYGWEVISWDNRATEPGAAVPYTTYFPYQLNNSLKVRQYYLGAGSTIHCPMNHNSGAPCDLSGLSPAWDWHTELTKMGYTCARNYTPRLTYYGAQADATRRSNKVNNNNCWIWPDFWNIPDGGLHSRTAFASVAGAEAYMDALIAARGFTNTFTHRIYEGADQAELNMPLDVMQAFMAKVVAGHEAGTLEVVTMTRHIYETLHRPGPYYFTTEGRLMHRKTDGTTELGYSP